VPTPLEKCKGRTASAVPLLNPIGSGLVVAPFEK
jgi:hypothetical protein